MLIAQILAGKGSDVISTRPEATIAEVARLLKEKRIGAVVVLDADGAAVRHHLRARPGAGPGASTAPACSTCRWPR